MGKASTSPKRDVPICGAKTRSGEPCTKERMPGKRRCFNHGGAPGSGAPLGNQNALKHGNCTAESKAFWRALYGPLSAAREFIEKYDGGDFNNIGTDDYDLADRDVS